MNQTELKPKDKSAFIEGAAVLGAAAIISKLLGTLQKIPLQNIAGDAVYGIYNAVYPLYILLLFITTAGIPIAVSKFVAEKAALGDEEGVHKVIKVSTVMISLSGIFFFVLLFWGADWIAAAIDNSKTALAVRSASFALLFVPVMAVLRGYFQGLQHMIPTGVSQVAEQGVRVITMIGLIFYFISLDYSEEWIAAGATFGSAAGAGAGLAVMACYWAKHRQTRLLQRCQIPLAYPSSWQLAKQILIYAVPICLGSIVVPIISIVDTFTIPRLIKLQGWNEDATMHLFGVYNRGLPLVQLVAMLASSVSVALVPVISEAKIRGDWPAIRLRSELAIRATWILGLASSAGLAALAPSINVMLYTNREGTAAMTIISLIALLSSLNIISGSLLQGMGCVTAPVRNLFIASAVKIGLNIILIPSLGILGAALSAVFAFASAAALNLRELVHRTDMRISLNCYAGRIGLSAGLMAVFLLVSQFWLMGAAERLPFSLAPRMVHTAITLMGIGIGTMIYGFLMFRLGAITEEDLAKVPNLEAKVRPLLKKLKYIS